MNTATAWIDLYWTAARHSITRNLQYRANTMFFLVGMIAEPLVYLVVWSSVADANGGSVGGYTAGTFAAYYIVWTLVRSMNIALTPYAWEWRVRDGALSSMLTRPVHPIHLDLGEFAGWKIVSFLLWVPIALVLSVVFKPELHPSIAQVVVFWFAIWFAFVIRSFAMWLLGMIIFWTTRVSAIFEIYMGIELIMSGRLVPLKLMPDWVQALAPYLPFASTFGFPITALVGPITTRELLIGLAQQIAWMVVLGLAVRWSWTRTSRRYTAVSG